MQQTNSKRHKHADLIHAWAEGAEIQFLTEKDKWADLPGAPCWNKDYQYRIKPKLVKKWKWVVKHTQSGEMAVTTAHYADEAEFNCISVLHLSFEFVQKVDSTEIEVEET